MLVAYDKKGKVINTGNVITSFRGEEAIFIRATRETTKGRSGKVEVLWIDGECPIMEYYDKVFELTVKEIETPF